MVGATLLFAGPALAADLAVKAPVHVPPPPPLWTGFYLGIHGGYGWGHDSIDADISPFSNPSPKGGVFGGQAGYNWQYGNIVTGLEIDASAADLTESQSNTNTRSVEPNVAALVITTTDTVTSKIDFFGSARARYLLMPDWLLYGTGGLAWAHDSIDPSETRTVGTNPPQSFSSSAPNDHFGWAAGVGTEYRIWQNLLLRAEYLHYGFGSVTYTPVGTFVTSPANSTLSIDVVRAGLSYKF